MLATALVVLGIAMVWLGNRCAGSPGGFASDHTGTVHGTYPGRPGTARGPCAWLGGAVLEDLGYVALLVAVMATV